MGIFKKGSDKGSAREFPKIPSAELSEDELSRVVGGVPGYVSQDMRDGLDELENLPDSSGRHVGQSSNGALVSRELSEGELELVRPGMTADDIRAAEAFDPGLDVPTIAIPPIERGR